MTGATRVVGGEPCARHSPKNSLCAPLSLDKHRAQIAVHPRARRNEAVRGRTRVADFDRVDNQDSSMTFMFPKENVGAVRWMPHDMKLCNAASADCAFA